MRDNALAEMRRPVNHARDAAPGRTAARSRIEFALVYAGVFAAPYVSFRHPDLFFTVSDFFFVAALATRLLSGLPLLPLGVATLMWFTGVIMLEYGLLASSLFYGDVNRGFIVFSQYLFAYIGLPLILTSRSFGEAKSLAKCGVLSMVAMCIFGIVAYALGHNGGAERHFAIVSGGGRLSGFLDNANGMGLVIAFTLPLLWTLTSIGAFRTITSVILSIPLFVALILTSSNTGLMTTSIAILVFLAGRRQIKLLLFAAIVGGLAVTAVNFGGDQYLPATFQKRVMGALESGDISEAGTYAGRYELMQEAWRLADHHFVAGMGSDQYRVFSEYGLPVHNVYLLLWNEGGLVSLAGYLIILASALIAALANRKGPHGQMILLCVMSIVATIAVAGMTVAHVYGRYFIVPLLLAIGLAVSTRSTAVGPMFGFPHGTSRTVTRASPAGE